MIICEFCDNEIKEIDLGYGGIAQATCKCGAIFECEVIETSDYKLVEVEVTGIIKDPTKQ